ncbi:MAG: DUF6788 family protein [Actinomycetales bacterium]
MSDLSLPELEARRAELFAELALTGDFRRGSVSENYRRCGKANCRCAREGERGHGPRFLWTRAGPAGRTRGRQLAAGEVDRVRAELAAYDRFAAIVDHIVRVNEAICEARPPGLARPASTASTEAEKGGP